MEMLPVCMAEHKQRVLDGHRFGLIALCQGSLTLLHVGEVLLIKLLFIWQVVVVEVAPLLSRVDPITLLMVVPRDVLFRNLCQALPLADEDGLLLRPLPDLDHLDLLGLRAAAARSLGVREVVHGDGEENVEQDIVTANEQKNEVETDQRSETLQD